MRERLRGLLDLIAAKSSIRNRRGRDADLAAATDKCGRGSPTHTVRHERRKVVMAPKAPDFPAEWARLGSNQTER